MVPRERAAGAVVLLRVDERRIFPAKAFLFCSRRKFSSLPGTHTKVRHFPAVNVGAGANSPRRPLGRERLVPGSRRPCASTTLGQGPLGLFNPGKKSPVLASRALFFWAGTGGRSAKFSGRFKLSRMFVMIRLGIAAATMASMSLVQISRCSDQQMLRSADAQITCRQDCLSPSVSRDAWTAPLSLGATVPASEGRCSPTCGQYSQQHKSGASPQGKAVWPTRLVVNTERTFCVPKRARL